MKSLAHHLHVPLPENLYNDLKKEAKRSKATATGLARKAIEFWLHQKQKSHLYREIARYAAECAGTKEDLDSLLEAASIESLLESEGEQS